jgi:hypothetical protein
MKRLRLFCLLFMTSSIAILLSGCASAPDPRQIQDADYGPYPSNYEEIIKSHIGKQLYDPYSAVWTFNAPVKGWNRLGELKFGWALCGTVNAKNRFGGYVGAKPFYVMLHYGKVVQETMGDDEFSRAMVDGLCEKLYPLIR